MFRVSHALPIRGVGCFAAFNANCWFLSSPLFVSIPIAVFFFFYLHPLFQITSTLHHNGLCNMFSDILRVSVPGLLFCVYRFALRYVVGAPIARRVSHVNKLALDVDIVGRGVVDLVNKTEFCVHVLPGVGNSHG